MAGSTASLSWKSNPSARPSALSRNPDITDALFYNPLTGVDLTSAQAVYYPEMMTADGLIGEMYDRTHAERQQLIRQGRGRETGMSHAALNQAHWNRTPVTQKPLPANFSIVDAPADVRAYMDDRERQKKAFMFNDENRERRFRRLQKSRPEDTARLAEIGRNVAPRAAVRRPLIPEATRDKYRAKADARRIGTEAAALAARAGSARLGRLRDLRVQNEMHDVQERLTAANTEAAMRRGMATANPRLRAAGVRAKDRVVARKQQYELNNAPNYGTAASYRSQTRRPAVFFVEDDKKKKKKKKKAAKKGPGIDFLPAKAPRKR